MKIIIDIPKEKPECYFNYHYGAIYKALPFPQSYNEESCKECSLKFICGALKRLEDKLHD